jgi:lipoprotein LpqH
VKKSAVMTAAALIISWVVAGCASGPAPFKPGRGAIVPGTAKLAIDGQDAGTTDAVHCDAVESLTVINAGDGSSGATALISKKNAFTVDLVRLRNVNGFSGDYNLGVAGDATVSLAGSTYRITGSAVGYKGKSTQPTVQPFSFDVAC